MTTKLYPIFILVFLIYSCDNSKPVRQPKLQLNDSVSIVSSDPKDNLEIQEIDCVFDTSTYKFTTEALKKYRDNIEFIWNSKENSATTRFDNGDTLTLSIGGCNHFGYSATLHSAIHFDNTKDLIKKAHWLAKTFFDNGFDTKYDECIKKRQFKPSSSYDTINIKSYDIINSDTSETNMIYEGFSFFKTGNRTRIEISGYVN